MQKIYEVDAKSRSSVCGSRPLLVHCAALARAPVLELPFGDAHFGLVTRFDVLYRRAVPGERPTPAEKRRVLRPGGRLADSPAGIRVSAQLGGVGYRGGTCPALVPHRPRNQRQMFDQLLDRLSEDPRAWNMLRRIVENGFRGEQAVIARELAPWQDVGRREFLDFGCGTGESAPWFPAAHYTGVDIAAHYIRFAGRHRAGRFAVTSGDAIGLASERFDAALVQGVFHHMPDDLVRATVAELHRVLKPGATLLVMEDIPPPDRRNIAGHMMHWLDRGGFIRTEGEYRALLGTLFAVRRSYTMRSGVCDYEVYVLERNRESGVGSQESGVASFKPSDDT